MCNVSLLSYELKLPDPNNNRYDDIIKAVKTVKFYEIQYDGRVQDCNKKFIGNKMVDEHLVFDNVLRLIKNEIEAKDIVNFEVIKDKINRIISEKFNKIIEPFVKKYILGLI